MEGGEHFATYTLAKSPNHDGALISEFRCIGL